ncbi:CBS domain-containing protein [Thermopirellula anaerolimosa]
MKRWWVTVRNGRKRWIREDAGTAASEYAVILAAIALGLLLVVAVGMTARESFVRIAKSRKDAATDRRIIASYRFDDPSGDVAWFDALAVWQSDGDAVAAQGTGLWWTAGGTAIAAVLLLLFTARKGCPFRRKTAEAAEVVPLAHEQLLFQKRNVIRRLLLRRIDDERGRKAWTVRVQDVMTNDPVQVGPGTPILKVAELMRERKIRHVLAVDRTGRVLGVISDRDVCRARGKTAQEAMSRPPITVSPETDIIPAVTVLLQRRISCLPVVRDDKVVGILTATDVLIAFQAVIQSLGQVDSLAVREAEETLLPTS